MFKDKNYLRNKYYTIEDEQRAIINCKSFYLGGYKERLLKAGNKKLPPNVLIWNLPTVITCSGKCSRCYAEYPERIGYKVRVSRATRYEISKQAIKGEMYSRYFIYKINTELKSHQELYREPIVRIHESGDMFHDDYLWLWMEIARQNPTILFYSYTKQYTNEEVDKINSMLDNFNIVKSKIEIDGEHYINYGDEEYINELKNKDNDIEICSYGIDNTKHCMVNCKTCCHCDKVVFKIH